MSGDIQPRKRKGKGKRKDDFEDEVIETKTHHNNNKNHNAKVVSNGDAGIGGGGSSGFVAKAIFLLLLVSLSLVVALILVELRAAMEDNALKSEVGEEMVPPPPPPPPPAMEEESPSAEASIAQEPEEEEPEPLSATPPLEEYVKVVREVVMETLPGEALPQPEAEDKPEDDPIVEEVVEVVEVVTPVEEVVEILPTTEEVVEPPSDTSPAEEVDVVQTLPAEDVKTEEAEIEDKGDEIVKEETPEDPEIEDKDDIVKEETPEEPVSVEVLEPVEATPSAEEEEEEEKEELPTEVTDDKEPAGEKQPVVDEEEEEEKEKEEAEEDEEEEEEEEEEESPSATVEEKVASEEMAVDKENEEEEEDWSQFGKEGSTGALTDAYLKVEVLAEDILALDPQNAMVAQVAPHMAGVLRAVEEGQTEGLLETLNHIQVILEDVKKRIEEKEEPAKEPQVEAVEENQPLDTEEKVADTGADGDSIIDSTIREDLEQADELLPENPGKALNAFGALLHHNPKSARAIYGRARSLDQLAETEKSNSKLEQAIVTYRSLMDLADEEPALVPLPLLRAAAERCIDRMKFRGFFGKALRVQQRLLRRFPDDITLRNNMGVTYLLMNQGSAAKEVFEAVLQQWPDNGFAQVHFGFVLKTTYNNITGGAYYMQKGIASMDEGTQDERFFFHLGDALQRQGKVEEAYKIYDEAVERGMFLNRYQRSLYNVDRLTSQPLWTLEQTTYQVFFRKLEENWEVIRNEGVALLGLPVQDGFRPEAENLRDIGDWKQYELFTKGRKITANCVKAPRTCSLIEQFPAAAGCKRGQVKFSVMQPNTHVHAHTGPTNCRLRAHLGLVVPKGVFLKVAEETVTWEEGKIFIFDDSWEHEVWHEGDSLRLVLIVDVWHPELTEHERKTLSPI